MKKGTPQKLPNRLTQYSALSLAIAGLADVNGQIMYTPNVNIGGPGITYQIDLNGDTFNDAILRHRAGIGGILDVAPGSGGGAILGNNYNTYSNYSLVYPLPLNIGFYIGPYAYANWNSYSIYQKMDSKGNCNPPGYKSLWCGADDKYLGLRFKIGSNMHYGWARLTVDNTADVNWILKDYAYNATVSSFTPGQGESILAGEGGTLSIDDNVFSKIKIVALNKSIALFNLPQSTNYRLFSLTGQSVLDGKIENNTYVIEANTLASGVYIIELEDNNTKAIMRKKIVL